MRPPGAALKKGVFGSPLEKGGLGGI